MTTAEPAQIGYRWPAEWEPHRATWLAWPVNPQTWPDCLAQAQRQFAELVANITRFEPVHVLAGTGAAMRSAETALSGIPQTQLHPIPTNDAWIRDHGPTFLSARDVEVPPAIIDWKFNSWGNKYPPFDLDDSVPRRIGELTHKRRFKASIVLEGGAIDGNGDGVVITTDACLLHPNRNPALERLELEARLCGWLGAYRVIWLTGEIPGDDTNSHVDQIARFVNPTTILLADLADHGFASQNARRLQAAADELEMELTTVALPMPEPRWHHQQALPASYANFYIINGAVIVPTFGDPADGLACERLQEAFPDREIVPQSADMLVVGLGAIHCLTQQEPLAHMP